ncbi:MAG: hypothetical protein WC373_08495 [Smithella sp.]|jgi:hypothetical protein
MSDTDSKEITIGGGSSEITINEAISLAEKLVAAIAALVSIIKTGKKDMTVDEEMAALKELYLKPRAEIEAEVDASNPPV